MTKTRTLALTLAALLLPLAACSERSTASGPSTTAPAPAGPGLSAVLFLGDSIAAGEELPVAAAFEAGGVKLRSDASDGGGNIVGPFSDKNWKTLPWRRG